MCVVQWFFSQILRAWKNMDFSQGEQAFLKSYPHSSQKW